MKRFSSIRRIGRGGPTGTTWGENVGVCNPMTLATGAAQRAASRSMCCRIAFDPPDSTVVVLEEDLSWKVLVASATIRENMTTLTNAQRHHGVERTATFVVSALPTTDLVSIIQSTRPTRDPASSAASQKSGRGFHCCQPPPSAL